MQPELIADYACQTGESPTWHPLERRLYWLDIPRGRMFRYDPASGRHEMCYEGEVVGGLTVQADGTLLLLMIHGAVKTWRDGRLETVIDHLSEERGNRFNDAVADPLGRVYAGVLSTPRRPGRLYRIDTDAKVTTMVEGLGTSNGLGFTPDGAQLYHSDSNDAFRAISKYDYDRQTGSLTNRRLFYQATGDEGKPDGLTVDAEGCVWSARWNGGILVRHAPDGAELLRIAFPAKKVSSVTFGGEDLTDIYVTTAGGPNRAEEGPGAGALFRLNLGIRGRGEFFSRVGL